MKLGLFAVNVGAGAAQARATAVLAEELGLESLWAIDHVVMPSGYETEYPYDESGKMMGGAEEVEIADPLTWLAFAAAVTRDIELGTGVIVLPQRNPVVLAKQVATLGVLSDGRLLLGGGVGWLAEEFDAVGVPFADPGRRTRTTSRRCPPYGATPDPACTTPTPTSTTPSACPSRSVAPCRS